MPPPKSSHLQFPSWPTHSNLYFSTNHSRPPLDHTHTHHRHIQTDIHAIVQLPSFAGIMPTPEANQPDSYIPTTSMAPTASPNPTSAANKQPHDRWQYVNLIPTPTVTLPEQPYTPPTFPSPIGGTPRNRRSKTPPRATTPNRTRQPDPRTGSPTPHRTATTPTSQQYHATVHPLPKRPPPSLYQAQQLANNLPPPLNRCSPSLRLLAGHVSKEDHTLRPHQRHRHRPQPYLRTPGQHITKSQHNSNIPPSQHR